MHGFNPGKLKRLKHTAFAAFTCLFIAMHTGCKDAPAIVGVRRQVVKSQINPLLFQITKTTPDEFESLVRTNLPLLKRPISSDPGDAPLLVECAANGKKSHAFILLRHGVSAEDALAWCKKENEDAFAFWITETTREYTENAGATSLDKTNRDVKSGRKDNTADADKR